MAAGEFGTIPGDVMFPVRRDEVIVQIDDHLHFWVPGKSMRTLTLSGMTSVAVAKDGKRFAVAFHDGRVAVYEIDGILGTLAPATTPNPVEIPATCGEADPLAIPPEDPPDPVDTSDGSGDSDPCGGD
jgi:hypothetical protein